MTIRILFVDDEALILSGLRRMLRPYHKEWDMTFIDSGEQALAILDQDPFDGLVGVEFDLVHGLNVGGVGDGDKQPVAPFEYR